MAVNCLENGVFTATPARQTRSVDDLAELGGELIHEYEPAGMTRNHVFGTHKCRRTPNNVHLSN